MIVITGAMMAAGAAAGGASGLKALGSYFKNRDTLRRKNKQIEKLSFKMLRTFMRNISTVQSLC